MNKGMFGQGIKFETLADFWSPDSGLIVLVGTRGSHILRPDIIPRHPRTL